MFYKNKGLRFAKAIIAAMLFSVLILTGCVSGLENEQVTLEENSIYDSVENSESTSSENGSDEQYPSEDRENLPTTDDSAESSVYSFPLARDTVADIQIGWNVGNSLDSYGDWINGSATSDYETAWGNPVITRELIHCVKEQGFNAVRVPVTYLHFMDENGKIDEVWLARVKEVVDYVLEEDMYCIIDIHHDTGASESAWIVADPYRYENGMKERFAYAWQQIAECFKDYDHRLIFEGMNEVLDASWNWGGSTPENYQVINDLNQVFVDTVRATGGNNAERNLIVVAYGNSSHVSQISGFIPPRDSVEGHLIVGIHVYEPDAFCNGNDMTWDESDEAALQAAFDRINTNILQKYQLPIIVGEFGARDLNSSEAFHVQRAEFATSFVSRAKAQGIACFWWDDGGSMKIFDRQNNQAYDIETVQALVQASKKQ